jgi:hypothetical protein
MDGEEACPSEAIAARITPPFMPLETCRLRGGRLSHLPMNQTATRRSLTWPGPTTHPFMDITAKEAPVLSNF